MEYTILGQTGRRVSRIGFGGATAGLTNYMTVFDPKDAECREGVIMAMRRALELGINYFDTAEAYGGGASEEIFAEGLADVAAEDIFLATKVTPFGEGNSVRKPDVICAALEAGLARLRRDYVDLIQLHGSYVSEEAALTMLKSGGIVDALARAREEGLVRHIGFSIEAQNAALDRLLESGRFEVMQVQYNLLFQHPYDPSFTCGSMYKAEEAGLGIVAMRTATSGIFQKWIQRVNPENSFDYNPALIQFSLSNPLVDTALIGMRDARQVEENAAICDDLTGRVDLAQLHNRFV